MESETGMTRGEDSFPTTIPRLLAESGSTDSDMSMAAWDALTKSYWKPVYKYLRIRHQKNKEDAQDLTQSFFLTALRDNNFERFDPKKAKFRTFVRCCVDRFVLNDHKRTMRLKRGGGADHLSMDFLDVEKELALVNPAQDPDVLFETEWLRSIFEQALRSLADAYQGKGKTKTYQIFEAYYLSDGTDWSYQDLATKFGVSTTEITNRLAGARREFRVTLLNCLRQISVSDEDYRRDARALLGLRKTEC
jgi:RNA polymerase sigma factor (sigma-70 family)